MICLMICLAILSMNGGRNNENILLRNQIKEDFIMSESAARRKLNNMGYTLKKKYFPTAGNGFEARYAIVDMNNVLVAGEYTMCFDDVIDWIKE